MPRKRPKTAADRPIYRPSSMPSMSVPEHLQPFLVGVALRHLVEQYGMANLQVVLEALIAERARRELIDRRTSETLDLWKIKMRPMAAARTDASVPLPKSDERRRISRYRRHREESVDSMIQQQTRDRELETGLAVVLERQERIPWYRREVTEIVDRVEAGQPVAKIAQELGVSASTVERRLADIRQAAMAVADVEPHCSPCPASGQNDGLGTKIPVSIEG